ncbi:MAG TPA: hypothetical protein VGO06_01740 [Bosea sp. (in: a-proteobacteria)]|uniref:hypothetical protein n=1 Tax=Bosea sp. (in: a-proteobacteria) TaxID=1871050 RepID=UPI002E12DBBC|nr:hypothetical protein [Bosea sp. (in: a-proteobacteria)]
MTRRILTYDPRSLHAVTIELSFSGSLEFLDARKSLHNVIAYRRRQSRWWRSVGLWAWWNGSGLHGLVELGSITATEFGSALRHHGDVRLRPSAIETVRTEVYRAAQSVSPPRLSDAAGRYQSVKIAIQPLTMRKLPDPLIYDRMVDPMPALF